MWREGAAAIYRCGCSVSSEGGYRPVVANGNELPVEKRGQALATYVAQRRRLNMAAKDDLPITAMLAEKVRGETGDVYSLPPRCAIHGEPAVQCSTWAFKAVEPEPEMAAMYGNSDARARG